MDIPTKILFCLLWRITWPFLAISMTLTVSNWCGYTGVPWCWIYAAPVFGPFLLGWAICVYTTFENFL